MENLRLIHLISKGVRVDYKLVLQLHDPTYHFTTFVKPTTNPLQTRTSTLMSPESYISLQSATVTSHFKTVKWLFYSKNKTDYKIKSYFKNPMPKSKYLLPSYHIVLFIIFTLFTYFSNFAHSEDIQSISCFQAMESRHNLIPFNRTITYKCPSFCSLANAWTPVQVGMNTIHHSPYIIGNELYRGDSWICGAALQQGIITNMWGGGVTANLIPNLNTTYQGITKNGIKSIDFNSNWPGTVIFSKPSSCEYCIDLFIPSTITFILALYVLPFIHQTRKMFVFSVTAWTILFWTFLSNDTSKLGSGFVESLASAIPLFAVVYVLQNLVFKRSLPKPSEFPVEVAMLWLSGNWIGLFLEYFSALLPPIPSLSFDAAMFKRPDSITTLLVIIGIFVVIILYQFTIHRNNHTLVPLLTGYSIVLPVYILFGRIVKLKVHFHHYMLALVLLPLTNVQTRSQLFVQGLLFGYFQQGVIKWGFASPYQTAGGQIANNGFTLGSTTTEWILNDTKIKDFGTIEWNYPVNSTLNITDLDAKSVNQFSEPFIINYYSLVINDVEIYRGRRASFNFSDDIDIPFTKELNTPYYFRVAPVTPFGVLDYGDISMIYFGNGSHIEFSKFEF